MTNIDPTIPTICQFFLFILIWYPSALYLVSCFPPYPFHFSCLLLSLLCFLCASSFSLPRCPFHTVLPSHAVARPLLQRLLARAGCICLFPPSDTRSELPGLVQEPNLFLTTNPSRPLKQQPFIWLSARLSTKSTSRNRLLDSGDCAAWPKWLLTSPCTL